MKPPPFCVGAATCSDYVNNETLSSWREEGHQLHSITTHEDAIIPLPSVIALVVVVEVAFNHGPAFITDNLDVGFLRTSIGLTISSLAYSLHSSSLTSINLSRRSW